MRFLLGLVLLSLSLPTIADTAYVTQIHDINFGNTVTEEPLVFLANGKIAKLKLIDAQQLESLKQGKYTKHWYNITLNDNREIIDLEETEPLIPKNHFNNNRESLMSTDYVNLMDGYVPSVITEATARAFMYESMHPTKEETQCFNRALVWTHEWRIKHNFYSNKQYIFFTTKFIRRYDFDWWFHVTPMAYVNINGEVKERMLDVKYTSGPLSLQKWAQIFLRGERSSLCPTIYKYSEYANYPEFGMCFFMKAPMYYYQPIDMEMHEINGYTKTGFSEVELKQAYLEAFEIVL